MSESIKTPAQLKAEELKAKKTTAPKKEEKVKAEDTTVDETATDETTTDEIVEENETELVLFSQEELDVKIKEATAELNDEVSELNDQIETLKAENVKLKKAKEASTSKAAIRPDNLVPEEEPKWESLNPELFTITGTNKSLSFSWFQFFKGKTYPVTWRNKRIIKTMVERKLWKMVKKS